MSNSSSGYYKHPCIYGGQCYSNSVWQNGDAREEEYCRGRRRQHSFDASLLQDFSYDEKLWNTSQETVPDTDMDGTDSELERRRLVSFRSHNDPNWKSILDLHSR